MKRNTMFSAVTAALGAVLMSASQNDGGGSPAPGNTQAAASTLQNAGFAPLTEEQIKFCENQLLETLMMFCPNDRAKVITREYWKSYVDTDVRSEYGGLGGIRFLAADIDTGINSGEWPWTTELSQSASNQTQTQQHDQQQHTNVKAAS